MRSQLRWILCLVSRGWKQGVRSLAGLRCFFPTGCWRNSFSLVVGLGSLFSCHFMECYNIASILWVFGQEACGILVPPPETGLTPSALEVQHLNHRTTKEVPLNTSCLTWVFAFSQASWSPALHFLFGNQQMNRHHVNEHPPFILVPIFAFLSSQLCCYQYL